MVLARHQICWCLIMDFPVSGTMRNKQLFIAQAFSPWYFCYGSQNRSGQPLRCSAICPECGSISLADLSIPSPLIPRASHLCPHTLLRGCPLDTLLWLSLLGSCGLSLQLHQLNCRRETASFSTPPPTGLESAFQVAHPS